MKAIVTAEGEYAKTVEFETLEQLKAYSDGVSDGSSYYSGYASVYTKEDLPELEERFEEEKNRPGGIDEEVIRRLKEL